VSLEGQDQRRRRLSPLWTIYLRFPKLDVAGSTPVSRSIFSGFCKYLPNAVLLCTPLSDLKRRFQFFEKLTQERPTATSFGAMFRL